jgi:hypothetical protein
MSNQFARGNRGAHRRDRTIVFLAIRDEILKERRRRIVAKAQLYSEKAKQLQSQMPSTPECVIR